MHPLASDFLCAFFQTSNSVLCSFRTASLTSSTSHFHIHCPSG